MIKIGRSFILLLDFLFSRILNKDKNPDSIDVVGNLNTLLVFTPNDNNRLGSAEDSWSITTAIPFSYCF